MRADKSKVELPALRLDAAEMRRLEATWCDSEVTLKGVRDRFHINVAEENWCRQAWGDKARSGPSSIRALRNSKRYFA